MCSPQTNNLRTCVLQGKPQWLNSIDVRKTSRCEMNTWSSVWIPEQIRRMEDGHEVPTVLLKPCSTHLDKMAHMMSAHDGAAVLDALQASAPCVPW